MKRNVAILALCLLGAAGFSFADDQFFDSDGVKIRYTVQGEGEPVVLVHGYTAGIATNWKAPGILDGLAQDYKVIALDCRGHGMSEKPHDPAKYGPQMAKDVVNLLDHLDIETAHVAGYSMGGMITINLIVNYPDRLRSAIVGGFGWSEQPPGGENFGEMLAKALENGSIGPLITALTPPGQPAPTEEQIKAMSAMLLATNDAKALAAVARGFTGLSVTKAEIAKNKVPVIGIVGEIDPLKVQADAMKANMGNVTALVIIPGADHMTAFGNPAMLKAMQDFLKSQSEMKKAA